MADYYDDSWLRILEGLQGGADSGAIYRDILQNFKGRPGDLEKFMQQAAPFLAQGLRGGPGYQYMQDPANWDLGAMGAYGQAAGQLGQAGRQASTLGQTALSQMGLGQSTARAALAQRAQMQTGAQQAGLFSDLFQRAQQNKMMGAQRAFDINRDIAQLALGQTPTPRLEGGSGPSGWAAGLGGALSGAGALAPLGPLGAVAGGLLGGLGGALS